MAGFDAGAQGLYGSSGKVLARHLHGGERRQHELREMNIVESYDGDISRHHAVRAVEAMQHANGSHVVGADDTSGKFADRQQRFAGSDAAFHGVGSFDLMLWRNLKAKLGHGGEKRVTPRHCRAHTEWTADEGDTAMP